MTNAAEQGTASKEHRVDPDGEMRTGKVAKLNVGAGFGYVADDDGVHNYIFVAGHALPRAALGMLRLGSSVRFRTSGHGRVDELVALKH